MTQPTRRTALAALSCAVWAPARAQDRAPPELREALPAARLRGKARMSFFGLHVYDIRLWAEEASLADRWPALPLALEIQYARALDGTRIAERSIEEMRRQASFTATRGQRWQAEMARLFPDVTAGDRLTGVQHPAQGARFYFNGSLRGELADPEFARLFFGIWLSPQTSEPDLRQRLLGGAS